MGSYDIRDRARLLKHLVFDENSLNPEKVLLAAKPAPLGSGSASGVNSRFRRGTLSDALGIQTKNYQPLPNFPTVAPPSSVRDVPVRGDGGGKKTTVTAKPVFSSTESESESESESDSEESTSGPDMADESQSADEEEVVAKPKEEENSANSDHAASELAEQVVKATIDEVSNEARAMTPVETEYSATTEPDLANTLDAVSPDADDEDE